MTNLTNWEILVEMFANGRQICNCRQAYYTNCGKASVYTGSGFVEVSNYPVCMGGCNWNQSVIIDISEVQMIVVDTEERYNRKIK